MKLYATTTSERASKGQGGNKYIKIDLQRERGKLSHVIEYTTNGLTVSAVTDDGGVIVYREGKGKAISPQAERLEYLRQELRAERISYGELAELQSLAEYIPKDDVELLEAAGVPEFPEESEVCVKCGEPLEYDGAAHCDNCFLEMQREEKGEKQKGDYQPRWCRNHLHDNNRVSCVC